MAVERTAYHSWCLGALCEGCKRCVKGEKLVLFITGLCPQKCFYCPVAENKYGSDVVYANEWQINNPDDPQELLEEARLTRATGAGITGGDPLVKTERCCAYIRLLKQTFGKNFHVHLYTPLTLVDEERLKMLFDAGLDEIRFHPDLDDERHWHKLELAKKFSWAVGVEIPAIPHYGEKTKKLIDFVQGKIDFFNLNELELSDTAAPHYTLQERGYMPKDSISYAVKDSEDMAKTMAAYAEKKGIPVHCCTAKLKDSVQVRQRILKRQASTALPFDKKTPDGLLSRGCAYLPGLAPGLDYRKKLKTDMMVQIAELYRKRDQIIEQFKLDPAAIVLDENKPRLLMSQGMVKRERKRLKKLGLFPALVEEYPTKDAVEMEVEFL
ncbi:MAG: radical SAM protein [archaeon]